MVMAYVPGGTFQMGSADEDPDEQPVHSVTLNGFWIDRTEVTNAQYAHCVGDGICIAPVGSDSSTHDSYYGVSEFDDYPVIFVNWNRADTYCQWAGGRLPTEAEWEYAARGPDGNVYPWGNDAPHDTLLNYHQNIGDTTEVGSYPGGASWVGAMDMAGNVSEWVNDWYGEYPERPETGDMKVTRGGGWNHYGEYVRAASRGHPPPDHYDGVIGFRCVVEPGN
jgi:formylglycine-generating enzyme required for sulfatase activity